MTTHGCTLVPSCSDVQEKSQKILRIGITLITVTVVLISAFLGVWIATNNGKTKTWLRLQNKKRGKTDVDTTLNPHDLWWSPNRNFALVLLPYLHILNMVEQLDTRYARSHWRLGTTPDVLGKEPRLHFRAEKGILEFRNSQDFLVWASTPAKSNLYAHSRYTLELTDEGVLQISGKTAWQAEHEAQIVWSSKSPMNNEVSHRLMLANQLYNPDPPLRTTNESHLLLLNDLTGHLQVWEMAKTRHFIKWQSSYWIQEEPPWFCVMSGLGFLCILNKDRRVIWSSSHIHPKRIPQLVPRENPEQPAFLKLTPAGDIQLSSQAEEDAPAFWISDVFEFEDKSKTDCEVHSLLPGWQQEMGFKRLTSDRLCLMGNDVLVSNQKLLSLTDLNVWLQVRPNQKESTSVKSLLKLDSDQCAVYYMVFEAGACSVFTDSFVGDVDPTKRETLPLMSKPKEYEIQEQDRPFVLTLRNNWLYLTTFQGTVIERKNISLLSEQLHMHS